jgi:hypothetical protein
MNEQLVVKAVLGDAGEWVLEVLGNPWGRDTHGERFSERTNFHADKFGLPVVVYYHGFGTDNKPMGEPEYIGVTVGREVKSDGVWYRVILDKAKEFAKRVWEAAQKGMARASSGSANHLVRKSFDGEILHWPVVELSVFDIDPAAGRVPAHSYAVALPAVKALYQQAGKDLPDIVGGRFVEEDEIKKLVSDGVNAALAAERKAAEDAQAAAKAEKDRLDEAVKAERLKWEQEAAAGRRLPDGQGGIAGAPAHLKFADVARYDGLSFEDQVYLIGLVNSRPGYRASEAAYKAAYIKASEAKNSPSAGAMVAAAKAAGFDLGDAAIAAKANELVHSTQTGYGDEWVGIGYSNQLWGAVRAPTTIAAMIPEIVIPQGSEGVYDPLEGADPLFYKVAETKDINTTTGRPDATIPASKAGSERTLHTTTKIAGRVIYSGEMEENALIPVATQLRAQMDTASSEALEHVIIDGDTATAATTNINDIANAGAQGATVLFTSFDGFRKLALVTNTSNSRDGGVLDENDFLETFRLMGVAGLLGSDVMKAIAIIDANVRWKILQLAAVKSRDVFLNATIENGELTAVYGYKIHTSYMMHRASAKRMANATGKIDSTDANNTKGAILGVRPDQWKLARKRRVTFESSRWPEADSNQIVISMSAGLKPRDIEAAAISYNLTV